MGPPLAAGIAAIVAVVGLVVVRYIATHLQTIVEQRITWLVCAPMLFSGVGILIVAVAILPSVTLAGLLLLGWGAIHLGIVATTFARMSRSAQAAGARATGATPLAGSSLGGSLRGPLGGHLRAALVLLLVGTPVALFGLLIWAAAQGG